MVLQCQADTTINRLKGYMDPPKFKRRRVSAVRDYPVLRKYPPPKFRKGVSVTREFPVELKAPATSLCDIHACKNSEEDGFKESNSSMFVRDQQGALDVPTTDIMDYKLCNVPNTTDVLDFHACMKPEEKGVEELSPLISIRNEQCEAGFPISNDVCASTSIRGSKPRDDHNDIHVRDNQMKPNIKDVEETNLLRLIGDEQCQVAQTNEKIKDPSLTKEASFVTTDHRCSDSMFGVLDFQASFNDDKDYVTFHDSQASFNDEECVETTLMEVNHSQLGPSNGEVITNNERRKHRDKVKEIINLFRHVYNKLLRDNAGKPKSRFSCDAASILLKQHEWIKKEKDFGPILGVEVGDYFDWRAELNLIGLHCQHIRGIDHMKYRGKKLATSVVDSRRFDNVFGSNDGEFPDTLMYFGEGGNSKFQGKKSIGDQKLVAGNLALKNSAETKNPIRVIRKILFKCGKIEKHKYVYDGLYFVDSYRQEITSSGKLVFKFLLKRLTGQPKLDWKELIRDLVCMKDISQDEERAPICVADGVNYAIDDISQGKERIPINALNDLDDEKPPIFNYVTSVTYPESDHPLMIGDGCDCVDGCSDSEDCSCTIKSGGLTYNHEELLMKAKPLIVECGPSCKCFTSCINRVSQRGIRLPLEVFKTKTKGWGVRSRSFIPCGSFICEYIGEVVRDMEGEERIGKDDYLFDIGVSYDDHSLRDANSLCPSEEYECFTIDAAQVGNVGRFINHSCSPNLFAQDVLFDHDNKRMPHIMLFSKKAIPPLEELTYHYNYNIGGVCDANGNIKMKPCYCGSSKCTGRMY